MTETEEKNGLVVGKFIAQQFPAKEKLRVVIKQFQNFFP
jgi:hypothetical protein